MPRGRKPKPTHLKIVENNPGKRPMPHNELGRQRRLRAPSFLTKDHKKIWRHCVKYAPYGLLQHIDTALLSQYVVACASFEEASVNYEAGPKIVKSPNGMALPNPWYAIRNRQSQLMISLASELGFTPAGRARLGVRDSHEEEEEEDDFFYSRKPIPKIPANLMKRNPV